MEKPYKIALLVGFDRCGSSMISRIWSNHPEVTLFFQPFNSTEVSRSQWEVWDDNTTHNDTHNFIQSLATGMIDWSYIQSDWMKNYSTSQQLNNGHLHIIKDTKFHYKISWLRQRFPDLKVWAIWRNPFDILASLVRNNFHEEWYSYLTKDLLRKGLAAGEEFEIFESLIDSSKDAIELMAIGIAMRTRALQLNVAPQDWLRYQEVIDRPNDVFNRFGMKTGLREFDFSEYVRIDYNVAGKDHSTASNWQDVLPRELHRSLEQIFEVILANGFE